MTGVISGPVGGVVFDLDGCLIDSEILSLKALSGRLQAAGISFATPDLLRDHFMGVSLTGILTALSQQAGITLPPSLAEEFEADMCRCYQTDLRAMEGAAEMLSRLTERAIPVAIATGSSVARLRLALTVTGLDRFFDGTACSTDEVAQGKPQPDLFLLAARRMGVAADRCIVLDDSPHGIMGANRAGMRGYGFVGGGHLGGVTTAHAARLRDAGAQGVFDRLADFAACLTA